ncbi:MAG: tetratricopeptide repeat protein [Acidobacteriota bacterium]|nr:tetratricopeptide repeat protein [Acidobacteriota bacterium]
MNSPFLSKIRLSRPRLVSVFSLTTLLFSMVFICQIGQAQQQAQLSLADILVALRSKKATIGERNKLLSDAVKVRGVTFVSTPEIETELVNTGAAGELLEAIKRNGSKTSAANPKTLPPPPTPAPNFAFYQKRANESVVKGEYDSAVSDFNEAIKLNPNDVSVYLNRGRAYSNKKNYDLAIEDYNKAIELNPKEAMAYFNRGESYEKKGNALQAIGDYQKVLELDGNNESAKIILKRLQDEQTKIEQAKAEKLKVEQAKIEEAKKLEAAKAAPPETTEVTAPKSVELGQLNDLALKLAVPVYPSAAQIMRIQGKVTVQIALDEQGKVVFAKAVNGHQSLRVAGEDAALKSKFKPTLVGNQPVKATGFIVYNFVSK